MFHSLALAEQAGLDGEARRLRRVGLERDKLRDAIVAEDYTALGNPVDAGQR